MVAFYKTSLTNALNVRKSACGVKPETKKETVGSYSLRQKENTGAINVATLNGMKIEPAVRDCRALSDLLAYWDTAEGTPTKRVSPMRPL